MSRIASTGGLICYRYGIWIAEFSKNIGCCSIINAEMWGVLDGLHLAWNLGIEKLVLEMDSIEAIQLIQTNSTEQHHSVVLRAIKGLLQLDWIIQIKHEFRDGNKVVDGLAQMASSRPLSKLIYMQPLDEIL